MARIRTIKPEFWQDAKLGPLPPIDRLVFLGLISQADDKGRLIDNVRLIDGLLFPYTTDTARDSLDTLMSLSRIARYVGVSGEKLIQIRNWTKHQRVEHPSKHTLPAPTPEDMEQQAVTQSSGGSHEDLATVSGDPHASIMDLGTCSSEPGPTTDDQGSTTLSRSMNGDVGKVIDHYRTFHPRARPGTKEKNLIEARLKDEYDVDALRLAIDGNHVEPYCCGENPSGKKYHALELIMRDSSHVLKYIEALDVQDDPVLGERCRRSIRAANSWLERMSDADSRTG